MRVAIITLQLHTNCGGVLQAYALERVLAGIGHTVEIVRTDEIVPVPKGLRAVWKYSARSFRRLLGQKDVELCREKRINAEFPAVGRNYIEFFDKYLSIRTIHSFDEILPDDYDAFVVGSDQVWRPLYNPFLFDSYLDFARGWDVRRVAFAVSFGTSEWEYSSAKTRKAAELASFFDALSFREESGCRLCRKYFGLESVVALDPTLLLNAEDWSRLLREAGCGADSESVGYAGAGCVEDTGAERMEDVSASCVEDTGAERMGDVSAGCVEDTDAERMEDVSAVCVGDTDEDDAGGNGAAKACRIFEYILDPPDSAVLQKLETVTGRCCGKAGGGGPASVRRFPESDPRGLGPVGDRVQSSPLTWLGSLSEADYVLTDSFHACVFSIIFHKRFTVLENAGRGNSRIHNLLALVGLEHRLLSDDMLASAVDAGADGETVLYDRMNGSADWTAVDARLDGLRKASLEYLRTNLQ